MFPINIISITDNTPIESGLTLLLDSNRGVYIPQNFTEQFDLKQFNITLTEWQKESLSDINNEWYWDAWNSVLDNASYTDVNGNKHFLHHDGDLWLVCYEMLDSETKENLGFYE